MGPWNSLSCNEGNEQYRERQFTLVTGETGYCSGGSLKKIHDPELIHNKIHGLFLRFRFISAIMPLSLPRGPQEKIR